MIDMIGNEINIGDVVIFFCARRGVIIMAKYNVELYVQGKYLFDDVEADTEEEAIEQCKYGTADDFWKDVGRIHQESDLPCKYCVVERYKIENNDYKEKCNESCEAAIEDVYTNILNNEVYN